MSDDGEAVKAIAALNGKHVEGRTLTINEARPKTDRPGGVVVGANAYSLQTQFQDRGAFLVGAAIR